LAVLAAFVSGAVSVCSEVDAMFFSLRGDYRDRMNCSEGPGKQEKSTTGECLAMASTHR
jgi:hypothetical protein